MDTLHDLNQAIGGQLLGQPAAGSAWSVPLGPVAIDSRQVEPGNVFWALRGPHHDGANFVDEAFQRGAIAAVVPRGVHSHDEHCLIGVDDTQQALRQWAIWKRQRFSGTMIAVTGSVGKTTARQMIDTILRRRFSGTASPRNYNNQVGVPLSMFGIEPQHDYAVIELAANHRGEIATLSELCAPKIGVITQIGDAHLAGFGSRRAIAEAKAELLGALPADGRAILGDDVWLRRVANGCHAAITWVGSGSHCDLTARNIESGQGQLHFQVEDCKFCVPVWGRHHLVAALVAVGVGRTMGMMLPEMAEALATYQPVPMRCEVLEVRGATIINDAYNSNPTAMQAALRLLRDFDVPGRRMVVCGDMAELGEESASLHWKLGNQIVMLGGAGLLIACGEFARHVVGGARAAGMAHNRAIPCTSVDEAMPYIGQAIQPGDVVLVKGSRMMAMERIVQALEKYPQRRSA
jgi:UDP-N-acetylmuramoyl-tripeptide--D-alanyl-D-alanine ligase